MTDSNIITQNLHELYPLGWNEHFQTAAQQYFASGLLPARIISEQSNLYTMISASRQLYGSVSGKFRYNTALASEYPTVGDWVMADMAEEKAVIQAVLPRKSKLLRADFREDMVMAANFDVVFIVTSMNSDLNIRRLERYVTISYDSGATPVILLNKCDLSENPEAIVENVKTELFFTETLAVSAETGAGFDEIKSFINMNGTVLFIGSSGVGKSSIINRLLGYEHMVVKDIREDDARGRHTTTHRQLIALPGGGYVIDTPGIRTVGVVAGDASHTFKDIAELEKQCKFRNCKHSSEPGCAVKSAIRSGTLDRKRYNNYINMLKEEEYARRRRKVLENRAQRLRTGKGMPVHGAVYKDDE